MPTTMRRLLHRIFRRVEQAYVSRTSASAPGLKPLPVTARVALPQAARGLKKRDRWFHDHLVGVPEIVASFLAQVIPLETACILDFGCGEGLMAAGLARYAREVHGVDLIGDFKNLAHRLDNHLGRDHGIPDVSLQLVQPGQRLPFRDGYFDAVFSWSVFEHVADVPATLAEIRRVLRPGGVMFLQIAPLYYSAFGSHLGHVLTEPWLHLRISQDELFERLNRLAHLTVPSEAQSEAFREKSTAEFRDCLMGCYLGLNRVTVKELTDAVMAAGFQLIHNQRTRGISTGPPPELEAVYSRDDLMTEQIVLLATR